MDTEVRRFACTGCGRCCNRSPEMELSEAARLADVFVFSLMFRFYWLPTRLKDFLSMRERGPNASASFYGRKRQLAAFSARSWSLKAEHAGRRIEYTKYLSVSALAMDISPGVCSALRDSRCGIYEQRPLSCRSVPFHYSHAEADALTKFDAFVATPGYRCDTSECASVVLQDGRIVDAPLNAARMEAVTLSTADRPLAEAITKRLRSSHPGLPTLEEIEDNSKIAATTTHMAVAWEIAAETGLISEDECRRLVERQLRAIDRALAHDRCSTDARQMLTEMRREYSRRRRPFAALALN